MVSLKDIARELGVSIGTVSMALSNSPRISSGTTSRVKQLAHEMGYVPNNFGRGLRSGKSSLIGCLVASLKGSFWDAVIEAVGIRAAYHQYGVLTDWADCREEKKCVARVEMMLSQNIDGLVITNGVMLNYPNLIARLERIKLPYIFCSFNCSEFGYPFVVTDDEAGGCLAARYLLKNGHRTILCEFSRRQPRRLKGNLGEINRFPDAKGCVFYELDEIPELIKRQNATAIISYSDIRAIDTINILRQHNIRVPEDISVVGYDNLEIAARPEFNLTTVAQQRAQLGAAAVDYIVARHNGENPDSATQLPPELIVRGTVRRLE